MKLSIVSVWMTLSVVVGVAAGTPLAAAQVKSQDGRALQRLEWHAPPGVLPGTYAEYLAAHPLAPAAFADARSIAPVSARSQPQLALLIDAALYANILPALDAYVADLVDEGYAVYSETLAGGTPAQVKAWVQQRYAAGATGVVFIGDITAAWAEVSGATFPCDLYYMDLDGTWTDTDGDGIFDQHVAGSGDEAPELYVARMYAHTLTYDTEANMVNGYLAKAHHYHHGDLTQPWRGLEYVDEDWFSMSVDLDLVYGSDTTRYDFGYLTTAADYLAQLALGQHFAQVCAHSFSGGHHFGMRPTESAAYAHTYVYSPTTQSVHLRTGSDDGIKVWLNGNNVMTRDVYQGWTADQFVTGVTLNAGWNRLLCKISQGGGDYQFSARFTDASGTPVPGLIYQLNDPATHGADPQFIRAWLLNGFHQDIDDNFWSYLSTNYLGVNEGAVDPDAGDIMGGKTWTRYSSGGGYVDLASHFGNVDFGASYAYARVQAAAPTACQLWVGYDDGVKVYLNGTQVYLDNRYGDYVPDMGKVNVHLNAGTNRLLIKVSEWMGPHGFSARLCHSDGSAVSGLTYDPLPDAVDYLGSWLVNGPYANANQVTRLSQDYLGGEGSVSPSAGDPAPFGTWNEAVSDGYPVNLATVFDTDGGWVYSDTIQAEDPPVLFYNLFSCGPGRFTDSDYLAGAYIFNTTWGLITVASSKSGSMLNFDDFTAPLGSGATVGAAYHTWFVDQAPYEQWEREWYYGMVLNGDPTLRPLSRSLAGDMNCDGAIDFNDINPFVSALVDRPSFHTLYTGCPVHNGDLNDDEVVDFGDINPFVDLLVN